MEKFAYLMGMIHLLTKNFCILIHFLEQRLVLLKCIPFCVILQKPALQIKFENLLITLGKITFLWYKWCPWGELSPPFSEYFNFVSCLSKRIRCLFKGHFTTIWKLFTKHKPSVFVYLGDALSYRIMPTCHCWNPQYYFRKIVIFE